MTAGAPPLRLREALLAPIAGKSDGPLVLVSAPGGDGKSTLLTAARNRIQEEGQIAVLFSLTELHETIPGRSSRT